MQEIIIIDVPGGEAWWARSVRSSSVDLEAQEREAQERKRRGRRGGNRGGRRRPRAQEGAALDQDHVSADSQRGVYSRKRSPAESVTERTSRISAVSQVGLLKRDSFISDSLSDAILDSTKLGLVSLAIVTTLGKVGSRRFGHRRQFARHAGLRSRVTGGYVARCFFPPKNRSLVSEGATRRRARGARCSSASSGLARRAGRAAGALHVHAARLDADAAARDAVRAARDAPAATGEGLPAESGAPGSDVGTR